MSIISTPAKVVTFSDLAALGGTSAQIQISAGDAPADALGLGAYVDCDVAFTGTGFAALPLGTGAQVVVSVGTSADPGLLLGGVNAYGSGFPMDLTTTASAFDGVAAYGPAGTAPTAPIDGDAIFATFTVTSILGGTLPMFADLTAGHCTIVARGAVPDASF